MTIGTSSKRPSKSALPINEEATLPSLTVRSLFEIRPSVIVVKPTGYSDNVISKFSYPF